MADEPQMIRGIDWKATFPFVNLFRGFRVAIHPSKLFLALIALALIYFGGKVLDGIWPENYSAVPNEIGIYGMSQGAANPSVEFSRQRDEQRKEVVDAYKARLHAIGKDNGGLADIKWSINDSLSKELSAARDYYDHLPADAKTPEALQNRDGRIALAYASAASDWQNAQAIKGIGLFDTFCNFELEMLNQMVASVRQSNWLGDGGVVDAIKAFAIFAPAWAIQNHWVFFTIFFLYKLCIWSIFGGAIARIAAVHVARDEKISIRHALRFSTSKFLSFLSAPIIPLLIIVTVGLVIAVGGFIANIPFVGPIAVGALFFVALIAGFVMTLVTLGTGAGFNLMYPTIAVEGSDSFDAISRSFSYIYARPWRMAFYSIVSLIYGTICYLFVRFFLEMMLTLTHKFVGLFIVTHADNTASLWNVIWPAPATVGSLTYDINYWPLGPGQKVGAFLIMLWVYLAIGLVGAFAISFYLSANTIIYFLMRNEVDATELDDVYIEQADDEFADVGQTMTVTSTTVTTVSPASEPAPVSSPSNGNEPPSGDSSA
ncbi:MAG TPA: hypothetical protein VHS31_20255 [Tepidisphaeraceae bacterium]|jgi:hypothetical protein|nr:hypothetical protein [Tepidisphaeraceae bacterium]